VPPQGGEKSMMVSFLGEWLATTIVLLLLLNLSPLPRCSLFHALRVQSTVRLGQTPLR
jgi:hypothetical protein